MDCVFYLAFVSVQVRELRRHLRRNRSDAEARRELNLLLNRSEDDDDDGEGADSGEGEEGHGSSRGRKYGRVPSASGHVTPLSDGDVRTSAGEARVFLSRSATGASSVGPHEKAARSSDLPLHGVSSHRDGDDASSSGSGTKAAGEDKGGGGGGRERPEGHGSRKSSRTPGGGGEEERREQRMRTPRVGRRRRRRHLGDGFESSGGASTGSCSDPRYLGHRHRTGESSLSRHSKRQVYHRSQTAVRDSGGPSDQGDDDDDEQGSGIDRMDFTSPEEYDSEPIRGKTVGRGGRGGGLSRLNTTVGKPRRSRGMSDASRSSSGKNEGKQREHSPPSQGADHDDGDAAAAGGGGGGEGTSRHRGPAGGGADAKGRPDHSLGREERTRRGEGTDVQGRSAGSTPGTSAFVKRHKFDEGHSGESGGGGGGGGRGEEGGLALSKADNLTKDDDGDDLLGAKTPNARIFQRLTDQLSKEILDTLPIQDEDIARELAEKAIKKGLLSGKLF